MELCNPGYTAAMRLSRMGEIRSVLGYWFRHTGHVRVPYTRPQREYLKYLQLLRAVSWLFHPLPCLQIQQHIVCADSTVRSTTCGGKTTQVRYFINRHFFWMRTFKDTAAPFEQNLFSDTIAPIQI